MDNPGKKSIITDLWNRRVPQFTATYVGICWGILQFLIFATNRYALENNLIDRFLIFAVVFLPAVLIFIYNHGSPGKDRWKVYEKILIPLNFILALVFAGLFSPGNEMNASPVEVRVTTEEGDTITRLVPSSSQTKSIAVFPLLNKGNADNDWLKFAVPQMMTRDLEQDMRMFCINPFSFDYLFKSNNVSIEDNDIPFSKYLTIAKSRIVDYFIIGDYSGNSSGFKGDIKVYETKTGDLFFQMDIASMDIFSFVDQYSKSFCDNLFLDDSGDKILKTDLPVAELISSNPEALKKLVEAKKAAAFRDDNQLARDYIDEAVALDNVSPMLKSYKAEYYYATGELDSSRVIIENALDLSESLPERQKFAIRQQYYIYQQKVDKYMALLETWRSLYPRDYQPYDKLIDYYSLTQNINKAKETGLDALANGHGSRVLKRLASFEITQGNLDKAESYINEYYKLFPDKNRLEDTQLAEIYMKKGEFDKAEEWYEAILLLNPNDHKLMLKLSEVYRRQWAFDKAEDMLYEALENTRILEDSINVYTNLILYYYNTGNVEKFNEVAARHFELLNPANQAIAAAFRHLQFGGVYTQMGQERRIREIGDIVREQAPQMATSFDCVTDFLVSLVLEDVELFEEKFTGFCKDIILRGTPSMQYMAEGTYAKMKGDYDEAIRLLETYIDTTGSDADIMGSLVVESYRKKGAYDKALEYCEKALKVYPSEASILLEKAKTLMAKGNEKQALQLVKTIKTKILKNSDERFLVYKDLLDLEKSLES